MPTTFSEARDQVISLLAVLAPIALVVLVTYFAWNKLSATVPSNRDGAIVGKDFEAEEIAIGSFHAKHLRANTLSIGIGTGLDSLISDQEIDPTTADGADPDVTTDDTEEAAP